MPENTKAGAVPEQWIDQPEAIEKSLWYKEADGGQIYPRVLIEVNGALHTPEGAKQLRDELNEILE